MCHWFRATCVCSSHIPHHRCCSVYVISRVQFAFHITLLNSTPQTFSHHTSFHHITRKDFTSHHLSCRTIPHHTIPHHITPLHNIPHHITTYLCSTPHLADTELMLQHILPRTTIFYITLHCSLPRHHHFTCSTSHSHSSHINSTSTTDYATPHPHSTSQHISHHNVPHRIAPPHCIIFRPI